MLKDGSVWSIIRFTFDGQRYQVYTKNKGLQQYDADEVICIGEQCGYKSTISRPPSLPPIAPLPLMPRDETKTLTKAPTKTLTLTWTGCGISKTAFMTEMVAAYKKHTGITIQLEGGGATKGIQFVANGKSDLGGTCRHRLSDDGSIKANEAQTTLVHVAWDALVPVINRENNKVKNITQADLKKVYAGDITSWKSLGGEDRRIVLFTRKGKHSGVGHMFRLLVFDNANYTFKANSFSFRSSTPLEKEIEAQKYGLGITGISSAKKRKLAVLTVDGVAASKEKIIAGKYPLFRPLFLAHNKKISAKVQRFIDYILSDAGQCIIKQAGTVSLYEGRDLAQRWYDLHAKTNKWSVLKQSYVGLKTGKPSTTPCVDATPTIEKNTIFSRRIASGDGYSHLAARLIKQNKTFAKRLDSSVHARKVGNALQGLANDRVLWPDDIIDIKSKDRGNGYLFQIIRDGVVLEVGGTAL